MGKAIHILFNYLIFNHVLFLLTVATSYCCAHFGPGYGPVWLNNMGCTSSNGNNLLSCSHDPVGSNNCPHTKDASASCRGKIYVMSALKNF